MKIKTVSSLIFCLAMVLAVAPVQRAQAQDLSKYRTFTIGTPLTTLLTSTDQELADVKAIHGRPAVIQELTWWPPNLPGASFQSDSVEQIRFAFYNGGLYKMSVAYDRGSTAGLTAQDMVKSISAKYGPATSVAQEAATAATARYEAEPRPVATWEDLKYSFNLVRSSFTDSFELIIYSKQVNAEAEAAAAEAAKLDEQEGPQNEADRQKKQTTDLEMTRMKNQKSFRP
jgi:hypothetical protein